jgi:hypothetical protein
MGKTKESVGLQKKCRKLHNGIAVLTLERLRDAVCLTHAVQPCRYGGKTASIDLDTR